MSSPQLRDGADAVKPWHAYVHDHDIGEQRTRQFHRLNSVSGLADDLDVPVTPQQVALGLTERLVIVRQQNTAVQISRPQSHRHMPGAAVHHLSTIS